MMYTTCHQLITMRFQKKKFFCVEIGAAHAEQKRHYKQFQSASFCLRKIFIFKATFVVERFIKHDAHR